MPEYRVTFGVKYGTEPHPYLPGVTDKHYVTVIADGHEHAREIIVRHIGRYFATDYPEPESGWSEHWTTKYGCTEFARWDEDAPVAVEQNVQAVEIILTVSRFRRFTREQIVEFLKLEPWEIDRTDAAQLAEMARYNDAMLDELNSAPVYSESYDCTIIQRAGS